MRKKRKQIYAAVICICMVLSLISAPVSAAEKEDTHEHTKECYTWIEKCVHEHTQDCYPQDDAEEGASEQEAASSEKKEPSECDHVCSEENGCMTKKEDCHYESKNGSTSAAGEMKQEDKDGGEAGQEAENGEEAGQEAENGEQAGLEAENGEGAELETEIEEALNEQKVVSVESVQDMIDALPDAEKISADNAEEVAMQLEAIDKAKVQLSDEELDQLDFTRYTEVIDALGELSKPVLTANGSGDVATAEEMKAAIGDSSISRIKMTADITLDATLIVDRMLAIDLNGCMLKGSGGSVIKVEEGGALNIEDNNRSGSKSRKFKPDGNGLWKLDENGTESISGGIITGGTGTPMGPVGLTYGGGICVAPGGSLLMAGGTIVGCTAECGGGVGLYGDSKKNARFSMMNSTNNSRIIGCTADSGGGVNINEYAGFSMTNGSITNCTANNGGGITLDSGHDNSFGSVTITGGEIRNCKAERHSGGISNNGRVTMLGGVIADCTITNSYGAGGAITNFGDGTLFLSSGGTISGGGANGVYNIGRLLGCGGTIASEVLNEGEISGIEGHTDLDTQFNSKVTNSGSTSSISGGRYNGDVKNDGGKILGGNFSGGMDGTLTITFDADNGESPDKQSIAWSKAGEMLTAPSPDPVKDGYTFEGWYYDDHGTETKWNFDTDAAKYTMTLTAKWTQNSAPVTPNPTPTVSGNTESGNGRRHRSRRSSGGNAYTGAAKTNSSQNLYTGINPFTDVHADDWFYNDVMFAYEKGLMSGIYADSFLPHGNTSRAEIAVTLYRLEGSPAVEGRNSFTDMEYGTGKVWYYDMVTWAQQNGIMDGSGDGRFGAGEPLTREELVSILYRYAKMKGYDVTGTEKLDSFTDRSDVSGWAQEAMTWAVSRGIINDRGNNLLEPKGAATRAEVAVMLHRLIEKYELQPAVTPAGTIGWIKPKEE